MFVTIENFWESSVAGCGVGDACVARIRSNRVGSETLSLSYQAIMRKVPYLELASPPSPGAFASFRLRKSFGGHDSGYGGQPSHKKSLDRQALWLASRSFSEGWWS
jgi:hypothetical protein